MVTMWLYAYVLSVLVGVGTVNGESTTKGAGPWWNNAIYYRILVDSFKDLDGDGLGDLQGEQHNINAFDSFLHNQCRANSFLI